MVKLINWLTGNEMYVAEERVEEYLKAGHKRPISKVEPSEKPTTEAKPKSRKKTAKK